MIYIYFYISKKNFLVGVKIEMDFHSNQYEGLEHKEMQFTAVHITNRNNPEEIQIQPDFENIRMMIYRNNLLCFCFF